MRAIFIKYFCFNSIFRKINEKLQNPRTLSEDLRFFASFLLLSILNAICSVIKKELFNGSPKVDGHLIDKIIGMSFLSSRQFFTFYEACKVVIHV